MEHIEAARRIVQQHRKCAAGLFVKLLGVSYATGVELQDAIEAENMSTTPAAPQQHAFLPPSGASSWAVCSLWPRMNQRFPQQESPESIEGTAAHWLAWEMFANNARPCGTASPNGTIITDEMIEGAELLIEQIRLVQIFGVQIYIERQIWCHGINQHVWGTADAWGYNEKAKHIHIWDYKFGHRFVDEYWNDQGLNYLDGIVKELRLTDDTGVMVSFTVVQPRCFVRGEPVRTHTFSLTDARPHFNRLAIAAEKALMPEPVATTNDHCRDCPGRHACPALQVAAYSDLEFSNNRQPVELSPQAAALELRMLMKAEGRIAARIDGLKEQTVAAIRSGIPIPYFKAEPGYGRTLWKSPNSQVIAIGDMFGIKLAKDEVITPKQAEKAGLPAEIVAEHCYTPTTGFRLVPDNPNDAARTFGALKEGQ